MKKIGISMLAASLLVGVLAYAEPIGDFGVNQSWNQPIMKRVKHTDAFGDTYYTYVQEEPSKCVKKEIHRASQAVQKAPKEVLDGLQATLRAIEYLQKGDAQKAKEELQQATMLFDQALKANPKLKLVPIDTRIDVFELQAPPKQIKKDLLLAQALLEDFRTQAARAILMPMEDEIDITTFYLPMDLYPKAAKRALKLLQKNKTKAALKALVSGVDTIVATKVVVPIPLLRAQEYLVNASKMAKTHPKKAIALLQQAKKELYKAVLLGYTDTHSKEYADLYARFTRLQRELRAAHPTGALFEQTKKKTNKLLNKIRLESKSSDNVWQGTAQAHKKAEEEELNDKLRFIQQMETDIF